MKIKYIGILSLACLLLSPKSFCYESYDYSPIDEVDYGYDNYGYGDSRQIAANENYQPRYSKYSKSARNAEFTGAGKVFIFDPKRLSWGAYYNGNLVNSGRASGGKYYCPDIRRGCKTPVGVFRISHKGGADCKSSKYPVGRGNAPMPWCMFFHGGYAIHGSWQVPNFNASHGCIRVTPPDAKWLSHNFLSPGTKVIVKSYR